MDDNDKVPDPVPNPVGNRDNQPCYHGDNGDMSDAPSGPHVAAETINFEIGRDQIHIPVVGEDRVSQ